MKREARIARCAVKDATCRPTQVRVLSAWRTRRTWSSRKRKLSLERGNTQHQCWIEFVSCFFV